MTTPSTLTLDSTIRRTLITVLPGLALVALACAPTPDEEATAVVEQSATAPELGTTESFAVLAGSTITNTGPTIVSGDLGLSPGTSVTGFPPGLVIGSSAVANAAALQAQNDATVAYDALAGEACDDDLSGQALVGMTLTPGTYCFSSSAYLNGTLTLDAQGDPAAVFVIQIGSTLTTASDSAVAMINGANPCNVFWQVAVSATLGTNTEFQGTIVALTSITLNTGASVLGRLIARNGAVTLDSNTVDAGSCQSGPGVGGGDAGGADAGGGEAGGNDAGGSDAGGTDAGGTDAGGAHAGGADAGGADAGGSGEGGGAPFCDGECFDLQTDPMHCGVCDNVCGAAESCIAGVCC